MAEFSGEPKIKQGWLRAIVFFIFYVLVIGGFSWGIQKIFSGKEAVQKSTDSVGAGQSTLLLAFFIVTLFSLGIIWLFRKFVDRRTIYSLGFDWNPGYSATGALAAVAMLGIGTLILVATSHLSFTAWNGGISYLLMNLLLMLLVAIMEETIFRGYLLNNLMQSMSKGAALVISSVLFAFIHLENNGVGILPILEIFIAGIMLGINYIFTRNLWFGIALHFVWNFLQGPVLGYEVSGLKLPSLVQQELSGPAWLTGGAFGFEGSVLAMLLNISLIVLLAWIYNRQQLSE